MRDWRTYKGAPGKDDPKRTDPGLELGQLADVHIPTPAAGDLLKWDATNGVWRNYAPADATHAAVTVTDTASIDLTLTGQALSAAVIPGGVDHNSLLNYVANRHFLQTDIDHLSTALSTGLTKVTTATGAISIVTDNSANWNTAYGWGNHASAGYVKADGTVDLTAPWTVTQAITAPSFATTGSGAAGGLLIEDTRIYRAAANYLEIAGNLNLNPGSLFLNNTYGVNVKDSTAAARNAAKCSASNVLVIGDTAGFASIQFFPGAAAAALALTSTVATLGVATVQGATGGTTYIGGTAIADVLNLQGTSGNGTLTAAAINLLVGNNGATNAAAIDNSGRWTYTASMTQAAGNEVAWTLNYTTNKAAGSDTGLLIQQTDTSSPGTSYLIECKVNTVSKFYLNNAGALWCASGTFGNVAVTSTLVTVGGTLSLTLQNQNTSTANKYDVLMATGTHTQTSGANGAVAITPTYNQTSGTAANTDLLINRTQTAVGSGAQLLADLQVGSVSKFSVSNTGVVTLCAGGNIVLSTTTGTKIGTATSQLLGFYNTTPVNQPDAVADATGAGDVVAQLNSLLARVRELGLIAT